MIFDSFLLKDYIVSAIKDLGFKEFSPIQKEIFLSLKENKNIIAKSKTGSGKTHSYLIPIFNNLDPSLDKCQALIICPTIELTRQVLKVAKHIASFSPDTINIKAYYGGTDLEKEVKKLENNHPHIVIATPGRLKDLVIDKNVLKIHEASYFILDEADMVIDSFLEEMLDLSNSLTNAKKMVFSATYSDEILVTIKKYLGNTIYIEPKTETVSSLNIEHFLIPIRYQEKDSLLLKMLKIINPYLALIFVNKNDDVNQVYSLLKEEGYNVARMYGNMPLRERKRVVNDINALKCQYVVTTDILARGIDILGVSHIINYELPSDFEFYIHRTGRAGRMDMSGIAYSFYTEGNQTYLDNLAKKGVTFKYLAIKKDELVEIEKRESKRKKEEEKLYQQVRKRQAGKKKVKPGYKKKFNKETKKIVNKIKFGGKK